MKKIFVTYGTSEGQTAKIAAFISRVIRDRGHSVTVLNVKEAADVVLDRYDAVIVGASIHVGKHDRRVVKFVRRNKNTLARMPSAFFSVSLAAHGDAAEAEGYVDRFIRDTGWQPDTVVKFSGALPYTRYGFIKRHLMSKIARDKPGDLETDLTRDYIYTDWDDVKRFAEQFAMELESQKV